MPQIIDAYLGLAALRQAGYKSTATAVAELVDNSLEAKARNIDIIAISNPVVINNRTLNQIRKIAVLDNGKGMDDVVLSQCLSMGWGTRLEKREGLGRFGFGLKGSSISQARRVEVYSWQSGIIHMAYLDLDEIKEENLQVLREVEECKLPSEIIDNFSDRIGESGTIVLWDKLDQIDLRRADTLLKRINKDLCRIYRHFLDDDEVYGSKREITLHMLNCDKNILESRHLKANDPLYFLMPNNLEGYENEATNELYGSKFELPIKYHDGSEERISNVLITLSIAKSSVQNLGGNSPQGKHYGNNTGISFVRSGREIDFDTFGFVDRSEPRHRWWGIEVRFDPVLDEHFGVTNNKQHIRSIQKLDQEHIDALKEDNVGDNYTAELQIELNSVLSENIKEMMKIITGRRSGTNKGKREAKGIVEIVNEDVKKDSTPTASEYDSQKKSDEEKVIERIRSLLDDDSSLSEEEAEAHALETLDYRVDILTSEWPGELFLDRRTVANASIGKINRNTNFYERFWNYLEEHNDKRGFEALEILFMAFVRTEDEMVREHDSKLFERFRQKWGSWVEKLITHAGN